MSAVETRTYTDENGTSLVNSEVRGVVASVSAGRILCALPAEAARRAGLSVGSPLLIEGETLSIAVVLGAETPAASVDAEPFELVLVDAELRGRINGSGAIETRPVCPSVGAEVSLLNRRVASLRRERTLERAVPLGRDDTSLSIDADRLLSEGLHLAGRPMDTAPTLALILRELLKTGFAARMVLIDTDSLFTHSFGKGASVVDVSEGLAPAGFLDAEELTILLECDGEELPMAEARVLARSARGQGGSYDDLLEAIERTGAADGALKPAAKELTARLARAKADPRFSPVFSRHADDLRSDDLLQNFYRLPEGRPPMAVCQLGSLPLAMRTVAGRFIARLGATLAHATQGRVPVLVAMHRSDLLSFVPDRNEPYTGYITSGQATTDFSRPTLLHPGAVLSADADDVLKAALGEAGASEAVLHDPAFPWPQSFALRGLPERAVPGRQAQRSDNPGDVHALIEAVTRAFEG